uniref:Uncharacterized protein n=1 Tax=Rousettus aegyptiacus TaxID=9407 RepID=A0A7J8DIB8_ROUAE|nr:hypothetical protein HJG63_008563 [Rousettus aegyptiacus]
MLSGYFKSWNRTFHICPAYFVFNTFHCAIFHLRLRGPCEGPECDLGAIPKHLCALGISSVERDAHRPSLQDATKRDRTRKRLAQIPAQSERSRNVNHCACGKGEKRRLDGSAKGHTVGECTSGGLCPFSRWGCRVPPAPRSQAGAGGTLLTPPLPAARL